VKLKVPVEVGVPEIVVEGVPAGASVRPFGKLPCETVQAYSPVPPAAVTVALYVRPRRPAGRLSVAMAMASPEITRRSACSTRVPAESTSATVKSKTPLSLGTPAMLVLGVPSSSSARPSGSAPLSDH
jgi:hypothetical protein